MRRILVLVVLSSLAGACSPAPPKPSAPTVLPIGTSSMPDTGLAGVAKPGTPRRTASEALKKAWPLDEAEIAIYADVDGLMKTKVMSDLARSLLLLATPLVTRGQKKCIEDAFTQTKEVAMGSERGLGGSITIARFDPAVAKTVGACVTAFGHATPLTLAGAMDAWGSGSEVSAVTSSGLFLNGTRPSVERALEGRGSGATLASVSLGTDEYLAWNAQLFEDAAPARGALLVTDDRLRLTGEGDARSEDMAKEIERELARSSLEAHVPQLGASGEQAKAVGRLIAGIDVARSGRHLALSFELRGPPAQQAADLGAAASLAVTGVRQYLNAAKQAEAKNTVRVLGKLVVTDWEREDGKPFAKKKLVSYAAVPKTVPRGVKYQSAPADWKPWAPLHFEMSVPQYYQYEIKAAKDGESAEIIARGDLNGDGKTSEFKVLVKVQRSDNTLRVAPSTLETNPEE
jgi:type IV pilus assembly protein PilA